jgi:hypothetical protein
VIAPSKSLAGDKTQGRRAADCRVALLGATALRYIKSARADLSGTRHGVAVTGKPASVFAGTNTCEPNPAGDAET